MPLGTYPFGAPPPFGADLPTPYTPPVFKPWQALFFDPSVQQWVILPSGKLQTLHPVDAKVAYRAGVPRGSLPIAPSVGQTWGLRLGPVYGVSRLAVAKTAVNETYADMIVAGDISIVQVTIDDPTPHVLQFMYTNNRLPRGVDTRRWTPPLLAA